MWFGTVGGYLYGGNEGIIVGTDANLVLNSGENDFEQRIMELSWDNRYTPERCLSPISGMTDDLPAVFDTILTFLASNEDVDQGVTGTIVGTDPVSSRS